METNVWTRTPALCIKRWNQVAGERQSGNSKQSTKIRNSGWRLHSHVLGMLDWTCGLLLSSVDPPTLNTPCLVCRQH